MKKKVSSQVYTNSLFRKVTAIYAVILLIMGILLCYIAYSKEHSTMVGHLNQSMSALKYEYESVTEDFWRLYMPFWSNKDRVYSAIEKYFLDGSDGELSPVDHRNLADALRIIMSADDKMKWIGVYLGKGKTNYLLIQNASSVIEMPDDFPFIERMENKEPGMEIYESQEVILDGEVNRYFALCGGTAWGMGDGKIIMGYESSALSSEYDNTDLVEDSEYYIVNDFGVIYDSTGLYESESILNYPNSSGVFRNSDDELVFVRILPHSSTKYRVFCVVPWFQMFINNNVFTPPVISMVLIFWIVALLLYHSAGRVIKKKIAIIQFGLGKIADNDLAYRIPSGSHPADEFEVIGQSINEVAERLLENINNAYLAKLRQREAELSELQSKFDPHFLYNTLEVIRGKVCENGDDETAAIIVKLAAIFRSFIGSDHFVSIQEEMDFCNLYLSMLKYRYDNEVVIEYDIDSDILRFGIIRNLLQPLLENYFVHGFNSQKQDNRLMIEGRLMGEDYICFVVRDNGLGITQERLNYLRQNLDNDTLGSKRGYGLRSINRRIKLFYGPECGLKIDCNESGGATMELLIRKFTCEEHKIKLSMEE